MKNEWEFEHYIRQAYRIPQPIYRTTIPYYEIDIDYYPDLSEPKFPKLMFWMMYRPYWWVIMSLVLYLEGYR